VNLEEGMDEKLKNFKKIFDVVIEEDIGYDEYVNTVISIGLDTMLRTVIPEGQEWNTLQTAFDHKYEDMCDLIADMWKKDVQTEVDAKKRIRRGIEGYIH
jgi:hypothetical protein